MIRLLLADAHFIVRKGLAEMCRNLDGTVVAGEAKNGDEVLEAVDTGQFDLMVIDPTMPGPGQSRAGEIAGAGFIKHIRDKHPHLRILVYMASHEGRVAKRLLNQGATGFVAKNSNEDVLLDALKKLAAGERYVDPHVAKMLMFEGTVNRRDVLDERITERELQVMKLIGQGKTINSIAEELFINSRTVSTHKTRLMLKMGFKNTAEVVRFALESDL